SEVGGPVAEVVRHLARRVVAGDVAAADAVDPVVGCAVLRRIAFLVERAGPELEVVVGSPRHTQLPVHLTADPERRGEDGRVAGGLRDEVAVTAGGDVAEEEVAAVEDVGADIVDVEHLLGGAGSAGAYLLCRDGRERGEQEEQEKSGSNGHIESVVEEASVQTRRRCVTKQGNSAAPYLPGSTRPRPA